MKTSQSDITAAQETSGITVPKNIQTDIRNGCIAACVSMIISIALTLISITWVKITGIDVWNFIDIGIVGILVIGVFKRSRTAATVLLIYFVASKVIMAALFKHPINMMGLFFCYLYTRAMIATFKYKKIISSANV
jgi:hypothetical protein